MILSLFPGQQRKLNLNPHPPPTFVFNFLESFPTLKDELIANIYIWMDILFAKELTNVGFIYGSSIYQVDF